MKKGAKWWILPILLAGILLISGCGIEEVSVSPVSYEQLDDQTLKRQAEFDQWTEDLFRSQVVSDAITLHYTLTRPEDFGISDASATFGLVGEALYKKSLTELADMQTRLAEFSYETLSDSQKLTYDILAEYIDTQWMGEDYYLYAEALTPTTGIHVQLPVLLAEYQFYRLQDVENYLKLLSDLPRYYGDLITFEQEKSSAGLFMSDPIADEVITACQDFISREEENYLIRAFNSRIDAFPGLSDEMKNSYKERNASAVHEYVIPAYQTLIDGLTALKGTGRNSEGLAHLPKGKEYYEYLVRASTGSDRSVEEMITWLEAWIILDINELKELVQGNPDLLEKYERFSFPLTDPEAILEDLKSKMKADFPELPEVTYSVKYIDESLEASSSPAFYLAPPIDRITDQAIYINRSANPSSLYTTLAHEGYPGHLYQNVSFANQHASHLRYLLSFKGYSEGWATYVENLAYNYCESTDASTCRLMQLFSDINLEISALMDLYVNYLGYNQEEMTTALSKVYGGDLGNVEALYHHLIGNPGNYLSYTIGYLEMKELRSTAEKALGDQFQATEFHRMIIETGPAPFTVLRGQLQNWLNTQ